MKREEAIVEGCRNRFRPILMTAYAKGVIAWGRGKGALPWTRPVVVDES